MIEVELDQIRDKEKESSKAGGEPARRQQEGADIGHRFNGGSGILGPFIVQTPWQGGESFFMEDLPHCGGTESEVAILEDFADFVDRMVSLSQLDDSVVRGGLAGSGRRAPARRSKETGVGITAELMAQDSKGPWAVAELSGHQVGGMAIDEIGPHGFILALLGVRGVEEEVPACC